MKLSQLTTYLESIAPLAYREDYDNAGLIVGNPDRGNSTGPDLAGLCGGSG
ncbi:Nif3-like dinuclear metal center hexameric protein [Mucilaginibacter humi]|uniref:Nif3-like dinuclear metal center hexameric protein n=1 Tax=Mucilaginibacter humi TaxID=2732510 RepID=UPI00293BCB08|nr:hypothetical protein [Mucilaginibacter humi]